MKLVGEPVIIFTTMIGSERLNYIPLAEKHLEELRQIRNDPTTNHWLTDIRYITPQAQKAWYERLVVDTSRLYMATEYRENGLLVGVLRSDQWDMENRSVRAGLDISPKYRGQGYGTEAFGSFVKWLFTEHKMHRVWLLVAEPNTVAIKLYKKLGFKEEGRQRDALFREGRYWDYVSMSVLEGEWKYDTKGKS